jgi:hypothetical protein
MSGGAQADIINFDFTGRMTVFDMVGNVLYNEDEYGNSLPYTPIAATLSYDTASGVGASGLSITLGNAFWGSPGYFHDISMSLQGGSNLVTGQVLIDWNGIVSMPAHVEWDATGLLNAIDYGLQVGDKLSGTRLYRDYDGDGVWGDSELAVADLGSATPYADVLFRTRPGTFRHQQGPAPLAATSGTLGLDASTPFEGFRVFLDIGSGNSMYVTSVTAVPVPAAAWLFGSGLLGLFGLSRCGKS